MGRRGGSWGRAGTGVGVGRGCVLLSCLNQDSLELAIKLKELDMGPLRTLKKSRLS